MALPIPVSPAGFVDSQAQSSHERAGRRRPAAIRRSVDREVVGALVGARPLLLELHQHVVEQRGRAEAEPSGVIQRGPSVS